MEQFKKWWINHNKEGHPDSAGFQFDSEVWKAALEWVLGPARENCYEPMDWYDNICEELGNDDETV